MLLSRCERKDFNKLELSLEKLIRALDDSQSQSQVAMQTATTDRSPAIQ